MISTDRTTHLSNHTGELSKVVILRALQFGDLLCAVPAFRALRAALPEARITLVGLPWAHTFVTRFDHYLDAFVEFPGLPGFAEREPDVRAFPAFLQGVQSEGFDLALQMQGSGSLSNTLIALFGARMTAGFTLPDLYCPQPQRFLPYPAHEHEIWRHLRLMEFLGFPLQGDELEFPIRDADWLAFQKLQGSFGLEPGGYACLHPGARAAERRWPPEKFARVAESLAARGLQVVLTGSAREADLVEAVVLRAQAPLVNLAGRTDLGALAALLSGARLLVSNDTGVSHLAAALKVPSVVLFLASEPDRWAPLDRDLHRIVPWATAAGPQVVSDEVDRLLAVERVYVRA